MAGSLLSQSEIEYIKAGCLEDCRVDGRTCTEFRPHAILVPSALDGTNEPSSHPLSPSCLLVRSNGSARLLVDNHVQLLCSVKADVVRPLPSRRDCGLVELSVDYHPHHSSSPTDDSITGGSSSSKRARGNDEEELQQLLEDLWLPHLVDLRRLCLREGECAWRLSIDLLVLSSGGAGASSSASASSAGCLLDAAAMVIRAALQNTWLPSVTVVPRHDEKGIGAFSVGEARSTAAPMFELAVEGDMAKAKRVVLADDVSNGGSNKERRLEFGLHLVTVTLLKCYSSTASLDALSTPRYVCVLDASGDEVGCSVCQVHVTVRTATSTASSLSSPSPIATSHICALQMSAGSRSGSIPVSLLSEASRLAIQAVPNQQRCCRTTELSHPLSPASLSSPRHTGAVGGFYLGREQETTLLQEAYALQ